MAEFPPVLDPKWPPMQAMRRLWEARWMLRALYARFERAHLTVARRGFEVTDAARRPLAFVDRITLQGATLLVEGWSTAQVIRLESAAGAADTRPALPRHDVAAVHGIDAHVGFALSQPWHPPGRRAPPPLYVLHVERGLEEGAKKSPEEYPEESPGTEPVARMSQAFIPIPTSAFRIARLWLVLRFAFALGRACPEVGAAWWRGDRPALKAAVKMALGLPAAPDPSEGQNRLDARLFEPAAVAHTPRGVTLVVPVYNAYALLTQCLDRVERHTEIPWRMIVIEDGSTDPRVRPWLRAWCAARAQVTLLENDTNMGFIGSVNRGLARARALGDHVVLLNTDALVPEGWAGRLLAPLLGNADVASATPLSNDAEICTAPVICQRQSLAAGQGDRLDAVARAFNPRAAEAQMPTGVGFCMALHIDWLARMPAFDPVFGRGYGEEVDWCQRVRALGGRHVGVGALFVEHRGGESFGSEAKQALIARNNARVSLRYPHYDADVQRFIAEDPLLTPRLALALAWAGDAAARCGAALPVYLAHSLGGGADIYLEHRIARDLKARALPAVVLRVGGSARWQIEVVAQGQARTIGRTDDLAVVQRLLAAVPKARFIYSCGVGDRDPAGLPRVLMALSEGHGEDHGEDHGLEVLVHDYLMVSPAYTLLDHTGRYRGPVRASCAADRLDPAHNAAGPLTVWQRNWGALLAQSETITTFSQASAALITDVYPGVRAQMRVVPHTLPDPVGPVRAPKTSRRVIAVLGNIGLQKGAAVVRALGHLTADAATGGDLTLMVLGNIDPDYAPPGAVHIHGDYRPRDLPRLVARYGITDWLIPSIWPETFCFTVHEALATGLPTYAFDLGAQGEAVRAAGHGVALPLALADDAGALMQALCTATRARAA